MSAAPVDRGEDPLLFCLETLTRYWHRPVSREALLAGLPLREHGLTPDLFPRAARQAGLSARLARRPLASITSLMLPAVLLLKGRQAAVWVGMDQAGQARLLLPECPDGESLWSMDQLTDQYEGVALFVRPRFRFDSRSESSLEDRQGSWFWGTLARFRTLYGEVFLATLLTNLFTLVAPLFTMNVYDRVVPNQAMETLWVLAIGVLGVTTFDLLVRLLRGYFLDTAGKSADMLMGGMLFGQLLGLPMAQAPASVGATARKFQEFEGLRDFFTSATLTTLIDLPFSLMFVAVIFMLGGPVVLTCLVAIPLVVGIGFLLQMPLARVVRQSERDAAQKNAILVETLAGVETIKTLGAEGILQRRWEQCLEVTARSNVASRFIASLGLNLATFAQQVASVTVVVHGVYLIQSGDMTMGALLACSILTGRALAPMSQVAHILVRWQQSLAALASLNQLMALPVERGRDKSFVQCPPLAQEIRFERVTFRYPGQQQPVLEDVSFTIRGGERVAVIGRMGCGKSTLLKMILDLYQPQSGMVSFGGVDVHHIDPSELRRNMGLVPQEVLLFFGTLRDNLTLGAPYVEEEALAQAIHMAGVDAFARRHQRGLDMAIGEHGKGLSGGQRQAVAIARALLHQPSVVLMDEPTSSMDAGAEALFMERLQAFLPGRTLILTTHKANLLTLVERVIVLENGRVAMDGPRDPVLRRLAEGGRQGSAGGTS